MKFILVLIALLPTTLSKQTYQFTFPDSPNTFPHVKFYGTIDHPLTEYTLCHWTRVNGILTNWGAIFSYITSEQVRALGTWVNNINEFHVEENNVELMNDDYGRETLSWLHTCVTSSVLRGHWAVYVDGVLMWKGVSTQRKPIPPYGTVVIGQDQMLKGGFNPNDEFKGHIADVFLWDRILNPKEIVKVYACDFTDEANVINWHLHTWVPYNGVQVSQINLPCGQQSPAGMEATVRPATVRPSTIRPATIRPLQQQPHDCQQHDCNSPTG